LSFGTGHHPTTAFCLEQIARLRNAGRRQSLLDMGSGSGILGIAAAKLGYAPVVAFDFDPDAVRVSKENAGLNQVNVRVSRADLTRLPRRSGQRFEVVCANLIHDLLIQECAKIVKPARARGHAGAGGNLEGAVSRSAAGL
jgi:ribosomal protein L11 methyltransferase